MASILLNFMQEKGLDIGNCRGQSYDNASNMSGRYNSVQAIMKRECKNAAFIPCCNHSLNLVGDQAVESSCGCTRFSILSMDYMYSCLTQHIALSN